MKHTVLSGLDRLSTVHDLLKGKRIGLMTNPTGITRELKSGIDVLHENYALTALFSCEHGVRGDAQAGVDIDTYQDPETGVMVYSVYGKSQRLSAEMLEAFDVLVFDMQDVGVRFYTYLYSLSYAMEACDKAGKPIVVLDRINPLGGMRVEGTILDERFHSFVGEYALPSRTGLTIGEYALWVKDHLHLTDLSLTVVPLNGWKRSMYLDDTDVPWVAPSPNCATLHAALCYIGTCMFEGTNLSEGRGTTLPFELIGAPWVDAVKLEARMAAFKLPGLYFRRTSFVPAFSKHEKQLCRGVQVHILDRKTAQAFEGSLLLLEEIRRLHPDCFAWIQSGREGSFPIGKLLGTGEYRLGTLDAQGIFKKYAPMLAEFKRQKKAFELYR
jgi:uncharacterized protein YbbC (DUF1343 family)